MKSIEIPEFKSYEEETAFWDQLDTAPYPGKSLFARTPPTRSLVEGILMTITHCPSCGSQAIQQVERDWTEEYQGHLYTVPALVFYECIECVEKVYDRDAMRKIEACSPAFKRSVIRRPSSRKRRTSQKELIPA